MGEMSSFYGGRQGASFVIVKHFDGIDIPENTVYTGAYYEVNNDKELILDSNGQPIKQTPAIIDGRIWKFFEHRADTPVPTSTGSTYTFADKYAEGMVQCFRKGFETVDEVNYGEYVIIDSFVNCNVKSKDNGQVYRRGLNSADKATAGAEYVGQITGPQGETPELLFDHYGQIETDYPLSMRNSMELSTAGGDIVPGSYIDGGVRKFNDKIYYVYTTIRNSLGDVEACKAGFKIPSPVLDFTAEAGSAYKTTGLIEEDSSEFNGTDWNHPFYQKWKITVPKGIKGVSAKDFEIVPTKTRPKYDDFPGTKLYSDPGLTDFVDTAIASLDIRRGSNYNSNDSYATVEYNGSIYYVDKNDCNTYVVRYKSVNYDNNECGDITYYEIGSFNSIENITLSQDGYLTVFYTGSEAVTAADPLHWIENVEYEIEEDEDGNKVGKIKFFDNTDKTTSVKDVEAQWIDKIDYDKGEFNFYQNVDHDNPVKTVEAKWVDSVVEGKDDKKGHLLFYNNTDKDNEICDITLKTIKDIQIVNDKFVVTYNTIDDDTKANEVEDNTSWPALNYIVETKITENSKDSAVPGDHLLILFSDPATRAKYPSSKFVSYYSSVYDKVVDYWIDFGNIKGNPGNMTTITTVTDKTKLYDDDTNAKTAIPPEYLLYAMQQRSANLKFILDEKKGTGKNNTYAGWGVTIDKEVYFYDYALKDWYKVASLDINLIPSETIVALSTSYGGGPDVEEDTLNKNGLWFGIEHHICAE